MRGDTRVIGRRVAKLMLAFVVGCGGCGAVAMGQVRPFAANLEWQDVWQTPEPIRIPIDETPTEHVLDLPALGGDPDGVLCLRFRARLHAERPAGWGHYLAIRFNNTLLKEQTKDKHPRVLNRRAAFTTTDPRYQHVPVFQSRGGTPCLQLFFGPPKPGIEARVITDREEGYWYLLDVSDVAHANRPNRVTLISTAIKEYWKGNPPPECHMAVDDVAIGHVPTARIKSLYDTRLTRRTELPGTALPGKGPALRVPAGGGVEIHIDGESYFVESAFSYPRDPAMGYNHLACRSDADGESGWRPVVTASPETLSVRADAGLYDLRRTIARKPASIEITDDLTNKTDRVIGVAVRHTVITPGFPQTVRLNGLDEPAHGAGRFPENPTVFVAQAKTGLGLVAVDNALRLQHATRVEANTASLTAGRIGLEPHETCTLCWSLYPGSPGYFDFINQVRRDWKVNFTIDGPWEFFDARKLTTEAGRKEAKALLARKRLGLFALTPWFEYYNGWTLSRDEYRKLITDACRFIKGIVPDARCLASIETNLVPVPLSFFADTIPGEGWPIGRNVGGKYGQIATPEMTARIDASPWRDSCIRNADGHVLLDCWYVGHYRARPALNLMVYPTLDNHRHRHMLEQLRWLLDDVGLDGVYIDQFSGAYGTGRDRYTHDRWDGRTVELGTDGRVVKKLGDVSLLSANARREWVQFALGRGKAVVCNSQPAVSELQDLPTSRFMETQGYDPLGTEGPPDQWRLAKGHLASPIGLGHSFPSRDRGADFFVRTVVAHLRYGLLYYYYFTTFPADGPRGGEYGPVNHMFPFTPRELHEGWVLGEERLITCVSGEFPWPHPQKPHVLQFDRRGRQKAANVTILPGKSGHRVRIKLEDWWEIAVVVPAP